LPLRTLTGKDGHL